jgi:hypothetical protein
MAAASGLIWGLICGRRVRCRVLFCICSLLSSLLPSDGGPEEIKRIEVLGTHKSSLPDEPLLLNSSALFPASHHRLLFLSDSYTHVRMPRQTRSSKKARQEKPIRLYDLNVHTRLHIYGFLNGKSSCEPKYPEVIQERWFYVLGILWQHSKSVSLKPYVAETTFAATLGDIEVLQYLQEIPTNKWIVSNCDTEKDVAELLAFVNALLLWNKNFKTFRWAHTMGFPMDGWVLNASVLRGLELDALKWLRKHNCPWSDQTFAFAVKRNNLDVLKWLRLEGCPWSKYTFQYAVRFKRDFEVLIWLRIQGCPWDEWSLRLALLFCQDNILLIQWLLHEQCPCTNAVLEDAIDWCTASTLQVLTEAKCKFLSYHFHRAIKSNKNMDVLKVLREAECPMDSGAFYYAVRRGDMEILRWLKEQGCPWNAKVFTVAIEKGDREIIRWLYEEDCPMDKDTCKAVMKKYVLNDDDSA